MKPTVLTWRHYTIKAAGGRALAYLTHAKSGTGPFAEAEGATEQAATDALKQQLEAREAERPTDSTRDMQTPTRQEFAWALDVLSFSEPVESMMRALALAGDEGITLEELADVAGYADHGSVNLQLGTAAAEIAKVFGLSYHHETAQNDSVAATFIIADEGPKQEDGTWSWIPRPELVAAYDIEQREVPG